MRKYDGHRSFRVTNIKFLCLNLWLGEMCTDDSVTNDTDANDDNNYANNEDARQAKHDCIRLFG